MSKNVTGGRAAPDQGLHLLAPQCERPLSLSDGHTDVGTHISVVLFRPNLSSGTTASVFLMYSIPPENRGTPTVQHSLLRIGNVLMRQCRVHVQCHLFSLGDGRMTMVTSTEPYTGAA